MNIEKPYWQRMVGVYASGFALTSVANIRHNSRRKHAGVLSEGPGRIEDKQARMLLRGLLGPSCRKPARYF